MKSPQEILEDLKNVKHPGGARDIVSLGMVRDVEVGTGGITVTLAPAGVREDQVEGIRATVEERVRRLTGVGRVEVVVRREPLACPAGGRKPRIEGVRHIVAVASAKGGVGKSTVAVNLALSLRSLGRRVGLLDADTYGPSVPVMLGLRERPAEMDGGRIKPPEKYGIRVLSLGFFIADGAPVIWRGPMVSKLLKQFLRDTEWGDLDFLVIDLPPGTGDAQLTVVQQVPLAGGLIVTTPQDVALLDVQRGIRMFQQVNASVLGVVENMSYHVCPGCGQRSDPFGHGGGKRMAAELGIPFLGEIPLVRAIREAGDAGEPVVLKEPDGVQAEAFREIARQVMDAVDRDAAVELPVIQ